MWRGGLSPLTSQVDARSGRRVVDAECVPQTLEAGPVASGGSDSEVGASEAGQGPVREQLERVEIFGKRSQAGEEGPAPAPKRSGVGKVLDATVSTTLMINEFAEKHPVATRLALLGTKALLNGGGFGALLKVTVKTIAGGAYDSVKEEIVNKAESIVSAYVRNQGYTMSVAGVDVGNETFAMAAGGGRVPCWNS